MGINDIIFLIMAILSGSIALTLLVGGVMAFQNYDLSEKRKVSLIKIADVFIFSGIFTMIYNVGANWGKIKEGRNYFYGCAIFSLMTVVFAYFVNFK